MKYRVKDLQIEGRYFWEGHIFDDKEYILECLIDFHSSDSDEDLSKYTLEQICSAYGWEIEEITEEEFAELISDKVFFERGNFDWEEQYDDRRNDDNEYPYGDD